MSTHDKILQHLQRHAGTEQTIAAAIKVAPAEVFTVLTALLESGQVELYQSQSGDEMYRCAGRVHMGDIVKRPNASVTWGEHMNLESAWSKVVTEDIATETPVVEIASVETAETPVETPVEITPKIAKKTRAPKKRRNVPFTPLSWEHKELNGKQYDAAYYNSLI